MGATAGMRLGAVWSVSQDPNVPYYGNGVTRAPSAATTTAARSAVAGFRTPDGRRVRRFIQRRECRAPKEVTVYLTGTFAQA